MHKGTINMQQVCHIYSANTTLEWCTTKMLKLCNINNNLFHKNQLSPQYIGLDWVFWLVYFYQGDYASNLAVCKSWRYQQKNKQLLTKNTIIDKKYNYWQKNTTFGTHTFCLPHILHLKFKHDVALSQIFYFYKTELFA